jgi:hypothetical protein
LGQTWAETTLRLAGRFLVPSTQLVSAAALANGYAVQASLKGCCQQYIFIWARDGGLLSATAAQSD